MGKPKKKKQKKRKPKKPKKALQATTADKHHCYELSVQEPEAEVDLVLQFWNELRGRQPTHLREDFCGTAIAAIEWVKSDPQRKAIAVDLDPDVLAVARERAADRLSDTQAQRFELIEADVRTVKTAQVDGVLAFNFSYYLFKTRAALLAYFKSVRAALNDDGLFLLDAYGGSDSFLEMKEDRECEGFTYVWDQAHYNPINGDVINHIHFRFDDGSQMTKAFTYEWRLWTLPELQELLTEAGFSKVTVYWEGTDEDEEGNGEFTASETGEACEGWVCYLAAEA